MSPFTPRSHRAVDGESTSTTRSGASGPAIPAGGARFGPPQVARVSRFGKCTAPMSTPTGPALMGRLVSLCKRRGFIFQSSEIYGGINGFWDYGPLGAELKRNVKELWWSTMTRQRDDVAGLEATIIMSPEIWK